MIVLITGGSGSGKSEFAENYLKKINNGKECCYLATMMPRDDAETKERIARHRQMRKEKGFYTVEQALDIEECVDAIKPGSGILLEDLSNLAANEMFREDGNVMDYQKIMDGIQDLSNTSENLVIVSNNIFEDGIEYDQGTKEYMRLLARLNESLAVICDEVYEVVVGIPVRVK
ncbi:MAG: bifunctional adenosylcobinamide kinase/adenosylcobinamide-phosphate guanylyltransferase [Lachnospiraceae bacterium]|nr:bifunctional adenosylcobinamide kinase/adenosylcobinamide-phosphate guanylyltransferase [Lachnospiraceae bacterium]